MWHGIDDDELDQKEARVREVITPVPKADPFSDAFVAFVADFPTPEDTAKIAAEMKAKDDARRHNRIPDDEDEGSEFRYYERVTSFLNDGAAFPRTRHFAYWFIHNAIAHPALGFFPNAKTVEVHELTSRWLNKTVSGMSDGSVGLPKISDTRTWRLHNVVAHPLIGVLPCKLTFALHDWTARLMNVPGWL